MFSRFLSLSFLLALASSVSGQVVIVNALSGKVLDLRGGSSTDGTAIQQWDWTGGANQQWQLTPLGNGYNKISSVATGKVLDVAGVSTADGALIQEWDWTGAGNQQWQIIPLGSSYNEILNLNSGKVLDDSGYSLVNGTQMQQWDWLNGLNQIWSVVPVQNAYQTTGQTNLYYNASTGKITATATLDYDYHSQYYYNTQGGVEIFDNQSGVGGNTWGYLSLSSGNVSVVATVPAYAGHTYEARSGYSLVTAYTYAQVVSGCGSLCSDWYDL
jgi:Ricin-type beta-trefoil lectin domain-like